MRYGFGIDVGGTTVKLAFLNEEGTIIDKWEIPTRTQEGGKYVLPDIAASVQEYLAKNNYERDQIIGIGIGVPGPVSDEGIVNKCGRREILSRMKVWKTQEYWMYFFRCGSRR